jgi:hypothetical protein
MNEAINARWLRWCLSAIVILLAIIAVELSALVGTWSAQAEAEETSSATFPDTTRQRLELLDEQRRTSAEIRRVLEQLRTGTIKVRVVSTDKENASESGKGNTRTPAPQSRRTGE